MFHFVNVYLFAYVCVQRPMYWGTGITFVLRSQVKQHAKAGRFDEVEAELRALDPSFATNHPKVTSLPRCS